jgi:coatomer subunit beta'
LPIIISGSEDGTVRIWNGSTFKLESTLSYGYERIWNIVVKLGSFEVGLGCDEGVVVVQVSFRYSI